MTNLTTKVPTHRLKIKLMDDSKKELLLFPDEIEAILQTINSKEQFFVFSKTGEFYPKFGAELTKLTENEIEWIRGESQRKADEEQHILDKAKKLEEDKIWRKQNEEKAEVKEKKLNDWIKNNQGEYDHMVKKEYDANYVQYPITEKTKQNLAIGKIKCMLRSKLNNDIPTT